MERLQLKLLGGFEARTTSGRAIGLGGRKAEALLAYLALEPGKRHGREKLADLLWSGLGDEQARNSLRKALTALRKALAEIEPDALLADRETVALDPAAAEIDVVEFLQFMDDDAPEQWEQGAALYRGELLEGFSLREPPYQEWLEGERRRFFELVLQALSQLLTGRMEAGQGTKALATAQRLLTLDPLHESAHRALMRLYASDGEREAALRQYQTLRGLLERELGIEPEPETIALVEAIRNGRDEAAALNGDSPDAEERQRGMEKRHRSAPVHLWRRAGVAAAVVVVLAIGLAAWLQPWKPGVEPALEANMAFPLPDKPSIAVLPFVILGDDPQWQYFADGITEDLITDLAKIDGLFVMARNTVFAYKDATVTVKQVAEDLGVRYVLEGSVRRIEDRVRINAQLIDSLTGFHLWADRFDGSLEKIFVLQDEILHRIVSALAISFSSDEEAQEAQIETDNPEAYDAFLRGLERSQIKKADQYLKAIPYLEKAIDLDPNYSRAHAVLADVYYSIFATGGQKSAGLTQKEVMDLTTYHLQEAMRHPTSLAFNVASSVHLVRGEYDAGIAAIEKAIALGAKDPFSYETLTKALLYTGHRADALDSLEKAARLDPLNSVDHLWRRGQVYYHSGRFEESAEQFRLSLQAGVNWTDTRMYLAANYGQLGRPEEAKAEIEKIRAMEKAEKWSYSVLSIESWSFQTEEIRQEFRDGLRKAGMEEIPWGYDINSPNMVRGQDIRSLYFGQTIKGTDAQSGKERTIFISEDGKTTSRIGELVDTGVVDGWHDERLCIRWEGEGRVCVVTFQNPEGTPEQFNEYDYVYFGGVIPFSQVD